MKRFIWGILFFLITVQGFSHPHIFFEATVQVNFSQGRPVSFTTRWWMDAFFSSSLIMDYDTNRNGRFDPPEVAKIESGAFQNIRQYGYFLVIRKGSNQVSPHSVRDFRAYRSGENVVYEFTVDLRPEHQSLPLALAVFDRSFLCSTSYREPAYSHTGLKAGETIPRFQKVENRDFPVHYDPLAPMGDQGTFPRWRPGLDTAYPTEIQILPADQS